MTPTALLVLQMVTVAIQHAAELNALLSTAAREGRDVRIDELDFLKQKATAALDELEAVARKG